MAPSLRPLAERRVVIRVSKPIDQRTLRASAEAFRSGAGSVSDVERTTGTVWGAWTLLGQADWHNVDPVGVRRRVLFNGSPRLEATPRQRTKQAIPRNRLLRT